MKSEHKVLWLNVALHLHGQRDGSIVTSASRAFDLADKFVTELEKREGIMREPATKGFIDELMGIRNDLAEVQKSPRKMVDVETLLNRIDQCIDRWSK